MFDVTTYNLLMELSSAFYGAMGRVRNQLDPPLNDLPIVLQLRGGYAESPGWYMIQAAEFDPEPLTVDNLRVRDTYAAPQLTKAILELLASEQWLDRDGDSYALTDTGRHIISQLQQRSARMIEALPLASSEEIVQLEARLRQLINASIASDSPPDTWCLKYSRRRAPLDNAPPLRKIFHYLADFNAFRDDAHMAAFQPQETEGYRCEAFTYVVDGQAQSADELFAQLAYRGYSRHDFDVALSTLVKRGWLARDKETGRHAATDLGKRVRNSVEAETDRYFYQPWSVLTVAECNELLALITNLRDQLRLISES